MNPRFLISKPQFFSTPLPATVTVLITPQKPGRVSFNCSYYPAQLHQTQVSLSPGTPVKVIGRIGITLLVVT